MILRAPAKINLALRVLRRRPDGYHDIWTLMQRIGLSDRITLLPASSGIRLNCSGGLCLPRGWNNLAYRAASILLERARSRRGVRIALEKRIPIGAGLGGGSSDAAAVLRGVNRLLKLGLARDELCAIGATLGGDVPFFLGPSSAVATGRGERMSAVSPLPKYWVVLANPRFAVSTAWAYRRFSCNGMVERSQPRERFVRAATKMLTSVAGGNKINGFQSSGSISRPLPAWLFRNDLQGVSQAEHPVVGEMVREMRAHGAAVAMMSGSGPTVFGLFHERAPARSAYRAIRSSRGWAVWLTETVHRL